MKLTVIMLDRHRTYTAVVYENEHVPYGRRTVQIDLTPEQVAMLTPRSVADSVKEEIGECWLEPASPTEPHPPC